MVQPMTGASSLIAIGGSTFILLAHQKSWRLSLPKRAAALESLVEPGTVCTQNQALLLRTAGGRYDGLLKSLWPPSHGQPMGAVGATLNVDRLITLAVPQQQLRSPTLQASQVHHKALLGCVLLRALVTCELLHCSCSRC